ncbi:MAG: hypothetical protein GXY48_00990 [Methanomicrobiales archaeon]|nr:hypothetical protein [Methanomicrobiales archaeon]
MQEKRPNKVLGYRTDIHGEPIQTLIGPLTEEMCVIFSLNSGETDIVTSKDDNLILDPFLPCDESVNIKIFRMMKKHPAIYTKFYKTLNEKIHR